MKPKALELSMLLWQIALIDGFVWVYTDNADTGFVEYTKYTDQFKPADALAADQFGHSISLSSNGETLAISAWKHNSNAGAVWVYVDL